MIHCHELQDRMPEVAGGSVAWLPEESRHLAECPECRGAWQLVQTGARLGEGLRIDADAIASGVVARLRAGRSQVLALRPARFSWRGALIGLTAAAASIALTILAPHQAAPDRPADAVLSIGKLPELQGLSENELESVLDYIEPSLTEVTAGGAPRLSDLTEDQLEQLLHSVEGG
jgi:hypothetical protein